MKNFSLLDISSQSHRATLYESEDDTIKIVVRVEDDEMADTSYIGTYNDRFAPGCVDRATGNVVLHGDVPDLELAGSGWDRREYRFWHPEYTFDDFLSDARSFGLSRHQCYTYAHERVQMHYIRHEALNTNQWSFLFVGVDVLFKGKVIGRASLGGVESEASMYIEDELVPELANEALADAIAFLDDLGSSPTSAGNRLAALRRDEFRLPPNDGKRRMSDGERIKLRNLRTRRECRLMGITK